MSQFQPNTDEGFPRLWKPRRTVMCVALVTAGIAQAVGAIVLSVSASSLLRKDAELFGQPVLAVFTLAAFSALGLFIFQNRHAERFALSYVHEVRLAYARHALLLPFDGKVPGVGLSLTRLVNDLGAIKLWLSRGLLALIALVPTVATLGTWIFLAEPTLLVPLCAVIVMWGLTLLATLPPLRHSIRRSRQKRGGMALLLGRALPDRLPLLLHGRLEPLLRRLARRSEKVCSYLIQRATWSGVLKACSRATFPVAVGLFVVTSLDSAETIVLFLMLFSFLATQLETGAAGIEYYEANKVAREKLARVFALTALKPQSKAPGNKADWHASIVISDLRLPSGASVSAQIEPATCNDIVLTAPEDRHFLALSLAGLTVPSEHGSIRLGEIDYASLGAKEIWRAVALVSQANGIPEETGAKQAAILGMKSGVSDEVPESLFEIFELQSDWDSRTAARLSEADRLNIRLARALLRQPKVLIIQDSGICRTNATGKKVRELAEDAGMTLLFLSAPKTD